MATIRLETKGLQKLLRRMTAATQDAVIRKGLWQGALNMQAWIVDKRLSGPRPGRLGVVTNRLRSSIATQITPPPVPKGQRIATGAPRANPIQKSGNSYIARIGTNVEYAARHEFGLEGMPARPFLRPALEDRGNQRDTLNILTKNIKQALEKSV